MIKSLVLPLVIVSAGLLTSEITVAQTTAMPDNSKSNKLDQSNMSATADAQSNRASDLELTKRIRQSVIADKSLSTYAHNVKIVAINGSVTLNGVVRSDQEKSVVQMKAVAVAGEDKVTNDLKVAPAN